MKEIKYFLGILNIELHCTSSQRLKETLKK
jgi:hypothetical protein